MLSIHKEKVLSLLEQFAEQALNAQRELEVTITKEMDSEDVDYSKKKLARIWMNAASCFAALRWDIDIVFEKLNVGQLAAMFSYLLFASFPDRDPTEGGTVYDQALKFVPESDQAQEKLFFAWLFAVWITRIDQRSRFQQPMAKPTVSNPLAQVDMNLIQAEKFAEANATLQKHMKAAVGLLNRLTEAGNIWSELHFPDVTCFLTPMKDLVPNLDTLMPGEAPPNVIMKPDFSQGHFNVDTRDFVKKTVFELLRAHLRAGHFLKSRELCERMVKLEPDDAPVAKRSRLNDVLIAKGEIMWVDPDELTGCLEAMEVKPSKASDFPAALQTYSEDTLKAMNPEDGTDSKMLLVDRLTVEATMGKSSSSVLQMKLACGMIAASIRNSDPIDLTLVLFVASNATVSPVLAEILIKEAQRPRQKNKEALKAFIHFVCGISSHFASLIEKAKETCPELTYRKPIETAPEPVIRCPTAQQLADLRQSDCQLWKLLCTFDYDEIRPLIENDKNFRISPKYKMPEMVADSMLKLANPAFREMYCFYLGKLEQLANLLSEEWDSKMNGFFTTLPALTDHKELLNRIVYEAVRTKIDKFNKCLHRIPYETSKLESAVAALQRVGMVDPCPPLQVYIASFTTLFLNISDWESLLKKLDPSKFKTPTFDMARLIARYLSARHTPNTPPAQVAAIGEEWMRFIMPTFDARRSANKPAIGYRQMETLLEGIKEPRAISFLLNFLGKLFNHTVTSQRTDLGTAGAPNLNRLFAENLEMLPQSLSPLMNRYVDDALEIVLKNAMVVNPTNAFWLRTRGDYSFAKSAYRDAMVFYLETLISCSGAEGLSAAFPENVVDDVMWLKMMICCQKCQYPTLGAIVVQMMADPSPHYPFAHQIIKETRSSMDSVSAYFPLIWDSALGEFMSDAYISTGQKIHHDALLRAISEPVLSHNNNALINGGEATRRKTKFLRVLCATFFDIHDLSTVA
ncbi:hypothetical protein L596_026431 [Steinernema carpocapsae]|uniref:INTS8 TPR repeats domain-containing protein n=1 Tax=Steinernema carpocapsae TaxID=34508 RepID=A0A4U5M1C4_STECR|nr:hypothetical protein L596_026431 [Steinernema carpocapsae]